MGHIMRTLVMAEVLREQHTVSYICNPMAEYRLGVDYLRDKGYEVLFLDMEQEINAKEYALQQATETDLSKRVGEKDQGETYVKQSKAITGDCLIVDSYEARESWLTFWRQQYRCILYMDDLFNLSYYDCDILLNKSPGVERLSYPVPSQCQLLLGTKYALIRKEFRDACIKHMDENKNLSKKTLEQQQVNHLLLTMGGSDPAEATSKILPWLLEGDWFTKHENHYLHVVVGSGFSFGQRQLVEKMAARWSRLCVHIQPDMANLMKQCQMAITAGGGTVQELAVMGIPMIKVEIAENQKDLVNLEMPFLIEAGQINQLTKDSFMAMVENLIQDARRRQEMVRLGQQYINAQGVFLICDAINALLG